MRFVQKLLPYNYAIMVKGRIQFIIKIVQLAAENYMTNPQNESPPRCPTRAILYADIKNMFDCVSREELMNIISECFPELLPLAHLLYGKI